MSRNTLSSGDSYRTFDLPLRADGSPARVTDYYGSNVFDAKAMAKRLTHSDVETIQNVMKFGGRIDSTLSDRVASAVREWAIENGASHYCHWFQPQTGATAEKHDAFLSFDRNGNPIETFTGRQLLQSEPDASSFPSGGIRSTFEARGYTGWDASSPMFIVETENGKTLYIPSVFVSYHGEALDFKLPLLRANVSLSKVATETLALIGEKNVSQVTVGIGAEQEFFVIDRELALLRPDLKLSGRTVFGKSPAKGQELEDHYFAHMPTRVQSFINEVEVECYKLGVPLKTRHNEVAPAQFEIAPIYEGANIACDHNHLLMKILRSVAGRHDLMVLLHEKPFAGINGSGKHVNWSLADSTGRNLLDPGHTPHENLVFLTFLVGVMQGIYDHADVLRSAIASAGNDHRLGANEAPPAIISCFLGNTLDKILDTIEQGGLSQKSAASVMLELGVTHLQELLKDNTDRNRTSPFAFTGNKFEFRAVGSSASIAYPVAILNAAATSGLSKVNARIKAQSTGGTISPENLLGVIKEFIVATKKIRFEANGYSSEWRDEAAKRGLSNFPTTPAALEVLRDAKKTQFLVDANVFTKEDVESRFLIQTERYIKQRLIEANVALEMAQTGILPTAMRYFNSMSESARTSKELGLASPAQRLAADLGNQWARVESATGVLKIAIEKVSTEEAHANLAKTSAQIANDLMPKLEDLRKAVDALEAMVPSVEWPFPQYSDMLFGFE